MALFKRKKTIEQKQVDTFFKLMTGYTPVFTTFNGGVYEMELTRACIGAIATHISKLKPVVKGKNNSAFERRLQFKANPNMVTSQFLYKVATILEVYNTVFIVPIYAKDFKTVVGYYPIEPTTVERVEYNGEDYFRFQFNGGTVTLEKDAVGVLNKFLLKSDYYGAQNDALYPTMQLLDANNQGIINGVQNSASIRFLAKLATVLSPADMEAERKRLTEDNLNIENNNGVMMYDQKYEDIKQVTSQQYTIDADQMELIQKNVFRYFGVNEKILMNDYDSESWNAFYEGKIEQFALQLSLVLTCMTFSETERAYGNEIMFTANRLQYLSPTEKANVFTSLFDRGVMTLNDGLEIFNLQTIGEQGDKRFIRKEYAEMIDINNYTVEHTEVNSDASESEQTVQGADTADDGAQ